MFTGLIEATAEILDRNERGLTVSRPALFTDVKIGSSIAVSGVCLTIVELNDRLMRFDVVDETWNKTKLGDLQKGDRVNLERAMRADGRFEGHVVQGHVEGTAKITNDVLRQAQDDTRITNQLGISNSQSAILSLQLPETLSRFVVSKGSIAIDGVSLTVASKEGNDISVALVPHTLAETTLGSLREGDNVHIETDMLVRAVLSAGRTSSVS